VIVPAAARMGIAVAAGVGLGRALGLGHAYWVGLTAAGILMGSNLAVTRSRLFYRLFGTVVGVGVAFLVLGGHPPLWLVILVAILFQGLIELVIVGNYGLAVIAITVLALTLFYLVTSEPLEATITARLLDTGVVAALAVVLRALLWPRSTAWVDPTEDDDLVAQHEELDVLDGGRATRQQDPSARRTRWRHGQPTTAISRSDPAPRTLVIARARWPSSPARVIRPSQRVQMSVIGSVAAARPSGARPYMASRVRNSR